MTNQPTATQQAEEHIKLAMARGASREVAERALETVYPELHAALKAETEDAGDHE